MEYFWLVIIVLIILRAIGVQSRRYKSPGKVDLPREDLPQMEKDYPQCEGGFSYSEDDYPYSVRDSSYMDEDHLYSDERLLSTDRPAWETDGNGQGLSTPSVAEPGGHGSDWTGKAGQEDWLAAEEPTVVPYIGGDDRDPAPSDHQLLAGGLSQHEVIKGMVWSQILGPRGGFWANRRHWH